MAVSQPTLHMQDGTPIPRASVQARTLAAWSWATLGLRLRPERADRFLASAHGDAEFARSLIERYAEHLDRLVNQT